MSTPKYSAARQVQFVAIVNGSVDFIGPFQAAAIKAKRLKSEIVGAKVIVRRKTSNDKVPQIAESLVEPVWENKMRNWIGHTLDDIIGGDLGLAAMVASRTHKIGGKTAFRQLMDQAQECDQQEGLAIYVDEAVKRGVILTQGRMVLSGSEEVNWDGDPIRHDYRSTAKLCTCIA